MRRAVLLDRDGTLVDDPGYLHEPEKVRLLPGVAAALDRLRAAGYLLVLVSNQSGIGRGYYREEDFHAVNARMVELLGEEFAGVYFCPHRPEAGCSCRKPGTRLLDEAARDLDLDLSRCFMVGDRDSDARAGLAAGCRVVMIGGREGPGGVLRAPDLAGAADLILGGGR